MKLQNCWGVAKHQSYTHSLLIWHVASTDVTIDTTLLFSSDDDIYTVETLPPAYSGLSIRLPPSYSQACRIIGYHRSQEHISEEHTNVGFENDVSEIVLNGSSSDLSNTNFINFPSSSDNTNSQDNIQP